MTCHTSADRTHMKMVTWRYIGLKQSSLMCLTSANCAHTWALTTPRESVTLKIVQLTMPHLCKPCTHVSSDNTKRVCHSENRPAYNAPPLQTAHTRELWQHEESLSLWKSSSLQCLISANCAHTWALTTRRESVTLKFVQLNMPHLCKLCTSASSGGLKGTFQGCGYQENGLLHPALLRSS